LNLWAKDRESIVPLKCEGCGIVCEDKENVESIDDTGKCTECVKE
jgi:hypothetical protein